NKLLADYGVCAAYKSYKLDEFQNIQSYYDPRVGQGLEGRVALQRSFSLQWLLPTLKETLQEGEKKPVTETV
ncbi:unnamed protein product, partial [Amoebophrya sp. A25]